LKSAIRPTLCGVARELCTPQAQVPRYINDCDTFLL